MRREDKRIALVIFLFFVFLIYALLAQVFEKYGIIAWSLLGVFGALFIFGIVKSASFRRKVGDAAKRLFKFTIELISSGGERKIRTKIPKHIKEEIMRRAGYRCQYPGCGVRENLEHHHIDGDPSNHNPSNLIVLCPNHHRKAQKGIYRREQLKAWAKGEGF